MAQNDGKETKMSCLRFVNAPTMDTVRTKETKNVFPFESPPPTQLLG